MFRCYQSNEHKEAFHKKIPLTPQKLVTMGESLTGTHTWNLITMMVWVLSIRNSVIVIIII